MNEFQAHRIRENNSTNIVFNLLNSSPSFYNQPEVTISFNPKVEILSPIPQGREDTQTTSGSGNILEPPTPVIPQPQPPVTPPVSHPSPFTSPHAHNTTDTNNPNSYPDNSHPDNSYPDNFHPDNSYPDNSHPDNSHPDNSHPDNSYPHPNHNIFSSGKRGE